jgi:site-specific DNA-methyltransferase (adenine-specific)
MDKWIFKCVEELGRAKVVALLPARTDTRWFHAIHGRPDVEIEFLRGRLRFKGSTAPAPFPSMLVYFGIKDSSLLPRAGG